MGGPEKDESQPNKELWGEMTQTESEEWAKAL